MSKSKDKKDVEMEEIHSPDDNPHHHDKVDDCALLEDTRTIMVG